MRVVLLRKLLRSRYLFRDEFNSTYYLFQDEFSVIHYLFQDDFD